jgi:hypothetical protein
MIVIRLRTIIVLLFGCLITLGIINHQKAEEVVLPFPSNKYPQTAQHIKSAINAGLSNVCTLDRRNAEKHRKVSLQNVPIKKGYDRDEWPMAMCSEGGKEASVKYISPKDNRGAGSWVAQRVKDLPDGTKVKFEVK